jgi:hypothetical protein
MKKVLVMIAAIILMTVSIASAQFNWVPTNQGTFQWDAVTQDGDGDPFPAGTHIEYEVFFVNSFVDPAKATPIVFERTTGLQSTVTFPSKGRYWVAVESLLIDDGSGEILQRSENTAWSDNPADCLNGETFGFQLFGLVGAPGGLRLPTP